MAGREKSKQSVGGSAGGNEPLQFGNEHIGGSLSGGTTPLGNWTKSYDYSDLSITDSTVHYDVKIGLGPGVHVKLSRDLASDTTTLSTSAAFGGIVNLDITHNPQEGFSITKMTTGAGVIAGAYIDTPWGGGGLAGTAQVAIFAQDGEKIHVGASGEGQFGTGVTTAIGQAHFGVAFEPGQTIMGGATPQRGPRQIDPHGLFVDNNNVQQSMYYGKDGSRQGNLPAGEDIRQGYSIYYGNDPRGSGGNWGYNAPVETSQRNNELTEGYDQRLSAEASNTNHPQSNTNPNAGRSNDGDYNGGQTGGRQGATQSGNAGDGQRGGLSPGAGTADRPSRNEAPSPSRGRTDNQGREHDDPGFTGPRPIVLNLDNTHVQITELSQSTQFVDATGDGLLNRSAWASAGNAVLFIDDDGDGILSEHREYIFTEWDPTATSDIEALRAVFDSNGDGVLDASDDRFSEFRLMVTLADGSSEVQTLAQAGIASIDLTADATNLELPDGSVITGQTTFTRTDGTTGIVADVTLVANGQSYRVEQVESFAVNGTRTEVSTGYDGSGAIAFEITSVTSADGSSITNSYDDNGDGVVDRIQTINTVTNGDLSETETLTNSTGSLSATAILENRTVTTTSADDNVVTIERDSTGGGWFDQIEVRTTLADGSRTVVTTDLSDDGSTIRSVLETISVNGLTRVESIDRDGDGTADVTVSHVIVVNSDGSRSETITTTNSDGTVRSNVTETVSADGQTKVISRDLDGDGDADTVEHLTITLDAAGSSTSTIEIRNGDGTLRSSESHNQSTDALTQTVARDEDGDGDVDVTILDATVVNSDGSRVNTLTSTNTDGSIRTYGQTTLGADQVSSETHVDQNQNGVFEATDLVSSITVDGTTQERSATNWVRNPDGTYNFRSTTVTSEDGLNANTTIDADGDGDTDSVVSDVTTVSGAGVATRTLTTSNQDGSTRGVTTYTTSADGLTITTEVDREGDGVRDAMMVDVRVLGGDGSTTRTVSEYAGDGTTLIGQITSVQSADRRTVTTSEDTNGDGQVDMLTTSVEATDGAQTVTHVSYNPDGSIIGTSVTATSANGLETTTSTDQNGDLINEVVTSQTTDLLSDGGQRTTSSVENGDGSLRSQSIHTISDDGLEVSDQIDANGDGQFERVKTSSTDLRINGSRVTDAEVRSGDVTLLSHTQTTISDDELLITVQHDVDGDGNFDLGTETSTTLLNDGGKSTTTELRDDLGQLRNASTITSNDNDRLIISTSDINGDGVDDLTESRITADNGVLTQVKSNFAADGTLQNRSESVTSANGLTSTSKMDADGDGTFELSQESSTILNADGSHLRTILEKGADGIAFRSSTSTVSDDGQTVSETWDHDADGVDDLTTQTSIDLSIDGIGTVASQSQSADGALLSNSTTITSADDQTLMRMLDLDGDGLNDIEVSKIKDTTGTVTTDTRHYSLETVLDANFVSIVSDDGFEVVTSIDRDGDGSFDVVTSDLTEFTQNGAIVRTLTHESGDGILLAREEYRTFDDGLFKRSELDMDGDGQTDLLSEDLTVFLSSGHVSRVQTTQDAQSNLLGTLAWSTSGNGLETTLAADYNGDGSTDRSMSTILGASGGMVEAESQFGIDGTLIRASTLSISRDGWSETLAVDLDGDGTNDRDVTSTIDASMDQKVEYKDISPVGLAGADIVEEKSANGMNSSIEFDLDGDGSADISFSSQSTYDASGNRIDIFSEVMGQGQQTYTEVTTTAANGLSSSMTFDMDGDGVLDGMSQSETLLNLDGSRETVSETRYADGELRSSSTLTISRDGRTSTETLDFDGNGKINTLEERFLASSGADTLTETGYNDDGDETNQFVTHTSADGLLTTITKNGTEQTITRSVVGNGTYVWDNGIDIADGEQHYLVTHTIDALGIEYWVSTKTWEDAAGTPQTETHSLRLDQVASARMADEATRLYDTVLDRDMQREEFEVLVQYTSNGELDKSALAAALTASEEFATRYGTMTDAGFVTQMYLNSFGRAPSLGELDKHLRQLDSGTDRNLLAVDLAESVEHLVIGNGHRITNNFDVIINAAEYERDLDRAFVEMLVKNLVDVAYDRDATSHEINYLSSLLLEGTDDLAAIAQKLLDLDGDIQGVSSNSTKGLSDINFVEQVYLNALGRLPDAAESLVWAENLSTSRITQAQFLASMAQSIDHRSSGNAHENNSIPAVSVVTGNASANTLTGGTGQDDLFGLGGNDTIIGNSGSDKLQGDGGNDVLRGGTGSDIYVWSRGDGSDSISDDGISIVEVDVLHMVNVTPSDITLRRDHTSDNLIITIAGTGGAVITVVNQFDKTESGGSGLETILFADGISWTAKEIDKRVDVQGTANAASQTIYGVSGNDSIDGGGGNDLLDGGDGDDVLNAGSGADVILGGNGNDVIDGSQGGDLMSGGQGDDTLTGGSENDEVWGDGGADELRGDDGNDILYGGSGADSIYGGKHSDILNGGSGDDLLFGENGNDRLFGDDGDDVLDGSSGADSLDGGNGFDKVSYQTSAVGVIVDLAAGTSAQGGAQGDTFASIEGVIGSWRADQITGDISNNFLKGLGGNDILIGLDGNDSLYGSNGDDTVDGGDGDDLVKGDVGNDLLYGRNGNDVLRGWTGNDTLYGGDGADNMQGGGHNDLLSGEVGDDHLSGDSGDDSLFGDAGNDTLLGGDGDDNLQGGDGADQLYGGDGNDLIVGGDGDDFMTGANGDDRLIGGLGNDTMFGGLDANVFVSQAGDGGDIIKYFGVGRDKLELVGVTGKLNILALESGTQILVGDATSIYLEGVNAQELTLDNFILDSDVALDVINLGTSFGDRTVHVSASTGGTVIGTAGSDIMVGSNANDKLEANDGADFLVDGAGADTLIGGSGEDYFKLVSDATKDRIDGFVHGEDIIDISSWSITGFANLVIKQDGGSVRVRHGLEDIEIKGSTVSTFSAEDFIFGGASTNPSGGHTDPTYNDVITGTSAREDIYGGGGNDTINGAGDHDKLYGGDGDDVLTDSSGNNSFYGEADNDHITGGSGHDYIVGGTGDDLLSSNGGRDTFEFATGDGNDTITDFDPLNDTLKIDGQVVGGPDSTSSSVTFSQSGADLILSFGSGDTILFQGLLIDDWRQLEKQIIQGSDGSEGIEGRENDDILYGNGGNDVLLGHGQRDKLYGGIGNDTLDGGGDHDQLYGGDGDDLLADSDGNNRFHGEADDDQIIGGDGHDVINGGTGNDQLTSGGGRDTFVFSTGDGNDIITDFDPTYDKITVNGVILSDLNSLPVGVTSSADGVNLRLSYGSQDSILIETSAVLRNSYPMLFGDGDGSVIINYNDVIGTSGDDFNDNRISGSVGADRLHDFEGSDEVYGGAGDDIFVMSFDGDKDDILDFTDGEDIIDVSSWSISGFGDLTITQDGNSVRIRHGLEDIEVEGIVVADLAADDFILA